MQLRVALPLAIFLHKALHLSAHASLSMLFPGLLISICPYACLRGCSGWHAAAGSSVLPHFRAQSCPPAYPGLTYYAEARYVGGKLPHATCLSQQVLTELPSQLRVALPLPSLHKALLLSIEDRIATW